MNYDTLLNSFDRRYRLKKNVNIGISVLITALGISSFCYGLTLEPSVTIFRWMTVDGTLFSTAAAAVFVFVNLWEILFQTELTYIPVYYLRLSGSVAEAVIMIVVLFSQLTVFSEHLPVFDRYDSFIMHLVVPVLAIASFLLNDSPIGKLGKRQRWHGTWFVTLYAVLILSLIETGQLPTSLIPYFFLDYRSNGIGIFLFAFVFIYSSAYLMSWFLSEKNRSLSWVWFRGSTGKKEG